MDRDIISYCSAIAQPRRMMKLGIISPEDFEKIDRVLSQKILSDFIEFIRR